MPAPRETTLAAALGGIDALVVCVRMGENARPVGSGICDGLGGMGITIDATRNAANDGTLGRDGAAVRVMTIPPNEESVIAAAARQLSQEARKPEM